MNHIGNRLLYGLYGVMVLYCLGDIFYLSSEITMDKHTKKKANAIYSKVQSCFDETISKQFTDEVWNAYSKSTLERTEATISVQKRWEMDGRWQKALEERC